MSLATSWDLFICLTNCANYHLFGYSALLGVFEGVLFLFVYFICTLTSQAAGIV